MQSRHHFASVFYSTLYTRLLLSAAECSNRLVHLELFHKNCITCVLYEFFVKKFQPVATFGSREFSFKYFWPQSMETINILPQIQCNFIPKNILQILGSEFGQKNSYPLLWPMTYCARVSQTKVISLGVPDNKYVDYLLTNKYLGTIIN